jgi:hypothetical protein
MLALLEMVADISRGCARRTIGHLHIATHPPPIRELTLGDTSVIRELLLCLLALWSCHGAQPQRNVGWLHRLCNYSYQVASQRAQVCFVA